MSEHEQPVAVVTGAGRGIGEAIVERLLTDGWHVVAVDRDAAALRALAARIGDADTDPEVGAGAGALGSVEIVELDVTDRAGVQQMFADLDRRRGRVDAVVNNAMRVRYAPISEMTEEALDGMFAIGLKAAFWTIQGARPIMARNGGGAIVNMSSPAATRGMPGSSAYSAVKGAVSSLTWQAARELGPEGIRVNGVIPGAVPTPGAREVVDDAGYELRRQMSSLGRLAEAADIAAAVSYLLSPQAGFVTGHLLAVDGGL